MRTPGGEVVRGRWGKSAVHGSPSEPLAVDDVAVLRCCTAPGPAGEVAQPELPLLRPDLSPVGVNRASYALWPVVVASRWLLLLLSPLLSAVRLEEFAGFVWAFTTSGAGDQG